MSKVLDNDLSNKLFEVIHEEVMQARIKIWKMKDDKNVSIAAIDEILFNLSVDAPQAAIKLLNPATHE